MSLPQKQSLRVNGIKMLLAMGLAGVAGYWCGSPARETFNEQVSTEATASNSSARNPGETPVETRSADRVRRILDRRREVDKLWPEIRCLSENEVSAAIGELGAPETLGDRSAGLRAMLFYRWGQINPGAANEAAKALFPKQFSGSRQAVITAWINQGGGLAAWNAVLEEWQTWDCTRSVPGEVADMLVASFSDLDDATAFREAARLNDENCMIAGNLCRARARRATATPGTRAAFLAAAATHPDPYVASCAHEYLFKEWAEIDPEAALEGTADPMIPEDEREQLRSRVMSAMKSAAERAAAEAP